MDIYAYSVIEESFSKTINFLRKNTKKLFRLSLFNLILGTMDGFFGLVIVYFLLKQTHYEVLAAGINSFINNFFLSFYNNQLLILSLVSLLVLIYLRVLLTLLILNLLDKNKKLLPNFNIYKKISIDFAIVKTFLIILLITIIYYSFYNPFNRLMNLILYLYIFLYAYTSLVLDNIFLPKIYLKNKSFFNVVTKKFDYKNVQIVSFLTVRILLKGFLLLIQAVISIPLGLLFFEILKISINIMPIYNNITIFLSLLLFLFCLSVSFLTLPLTIYNYNHLLLFYKKAGKK